MNEIGSEFELNPELFKNRITSWSKFFPRKNLLFLASGRDSVVYAVKAFKIKKILVPSYIESLVTKQILQEEVKIQFFKINNDLSVNLKDIEKKIQNVDSLLVVHYFGFLQPIKELKSLCTKSGVFLIEDCVQSMLSSFSGKPIGSFGDFSFNSLRKFIGIPDGSIVSSRKRIPTHESNLHKKLVKQRTDALIGKYHYMQGNKNYSRYYFKKAFVGPEKMINNYPKPAPMSSKSKQVLIRTNFPRIIKIRRKNFLFLLSKLEKKAFYKKLPKNVCPMGFPIISKNRDRIKKLLVKNKIYPPIHWKLPMIIDKSEFKESWNISNHILTMPMDETYSTMDMERIAKILKNPRHS